MDSHEVEFPTLNDAMDYIEGQVDQMVAEYPEECADLNLDIELCQIRQVDWAAEYRKRKERV